MVLGYSLAFVCLLVAAVCQGALMAGRAEGEKTASPGGESDAAGEDGGGNLANAFVVFVFLAKFFISLVFGVVYLYGGEILPTSLRGIGMGQMSFIARASRELEMGLEMQCFAKERRLWCLLCRHTDRREGSHFFFFCDVTGFRFWFFNSKAVQKAIRKSNLKSY